MARKKKSKRGKVREWVSLECPECGSRNYRTPAKREAEKLSLKKYCSKCRKRTVHKEKKK